jgi:hypothetical protein
MADARPGLGLPNDRACRLAARQAFVELKSAFVDAVAPLPGRHGEWLRRQVRRTEEPIDLWLLRAAVYAELGAQPAAAGHGQDSLRRGLDTLFHDSGLSAGHAPR